MKCTDRHAFEEANQRQKLSDRELDVLELICEADSNNQIASKLGISIKTVENHVRSILLKLKVKNRIEAFKLVVSLTHDHEWTIREVGL